MTAPYRNTFIATAAAFVMAGAAAQSTNSPYYIGGALSFGHLSNALGLAEGVALPAGYTSKSDSVTAVSLVGGLDQPIGRQRVFGDFTLRENRYARNELLDHRSYAVTAGLDWETVERISGNVALKSTRDLITFSSFDQPTGAKNLVTTRNADASVRVGVITRYTFEGGAGYRSVDYSDASYDSRDFRQNSAFVGMRYWPSGTNYVGLTLRDTNGRYPSASQNGQPVSDRFDRQDVEVNLFLKTSGSTDVLLRVAYSKIDHEIQPLLDFSGFTGLLRANWLPTAKVQLLAEVARDRGQDLAFMLDDFRRVNSARLATSARLRAAYAATAKIELHTNAGYTRRDVSETVPLLNLQINNGREAATQFGLGASWTPTRTSRVGCDVSYEKRRSDVAASRLNLSSNTTSCYGQLSLQP